MIPTGADILTAAIATIGTPYQHQGRQIGIGLDCLGVPLYCLARFGIAVEAPVDYARRPDGVMLREQIERFCIVTPTPQPGVLLLLKIGKHPQHCAILGDDGRMIHADSEAERVTHVQFDQKWLDRLVNFYQLPSVIYGG